MTPGLQSVGKTLSWRWRHFALFSGPEWHRVLELRTAIFVVEQECPYQEVDNKDTNSWHLEVTHEDELIEVTPESIRLRKKLLLEHERKRASRKAA